MGTLQEKLENLISESKYDEAGELFLKETGAEIKVEFKKHGYYFDSDKETRDIYSVTIKRNNREYSFDFGQSIANSGFYFMTGKRKHHIPRELLNSKDILSIAKRICYDFNPKIDKIHKPISPNAYTILSCITKYDPGDFEEFCSEYGYSTDSISANKTYNAVLDEWINMQRLFTNDELMAMSEIS